MKNSTVGLNRRQNGSISTNAVCPVCGGGFNKYRAWHVFCSPKCRKRAWMTSHRTGVYTDIRIEIAKIKADVAAILNIFKTLREERRVPPQIS